VNAFQRVWFRFNSSCSKLWQRTMSSTDKQLKALKRRLKEWEAAFLKAHGRKATVQDIAKDPSIGTTIEC
jgi:hypothetical protein